MTHYHARVADPLDLGELVARVEGRRPADALAAIESANQVAVEVGALVDRLIGYYVERARSEGHSWSQIGALMGISRQAAQQRFGARQATLGLADLERAGALKRLTGRAREALARAEEEARRAGRRSVTPAQLLDAVLVDEESLATRAVARVGIAPAALRGSLAADLAPGDGPAPEVVTIHPALRRALTAAVTEALQLGHNYVGTEHLLLGLIRDPASAEARALGAFGVQPDQVRRAVVELIDEFLRNRR